MNQKLPNVEEFKERATVIYEKQRDENRAMAIVTIAEGLLSNYCAGADYVFASTEERIKFIQSMPTTVA